jgi:integrase
MTLAMTRPWKHPKTGMYWLRKRVPEDLRGLLGKREEKRSLKTKNVAEAKTRLSQALVELEAKWENLKRGPVTLTEVQAHEFAAPIYDRWIRIHKDNPSEQRAWNTEIGVAGVWELPPSIFPAHLITAYDAAPSMQDRCFQTADELLEKSGLSVDEKSRKRLARAVSAAMHRASLELERMALGGPTEPGPSTKSEQARRGVRLRDLLDGWAKEKKPGQKTLYDWTRVVGQLEEFLGHSDAGRIKSSDLNRWKAALIEKGLRAKTIRDGRIAPIRAILQWGVDNDRLTANPAARIILGVKQKAGERKRSYTEEEAQKILTAARKQRAAPLRWLPWLSAFTGARIAELSQIRKEDISRVEDVWCIRITPEAGSIKTLSSERLVPIHSALIKEGFLDFVKLAKAGPLFPQLKPDKFGARGGTGTKILARWIRSLGLVDRRISPSHSWRHRFKTLSRRHGLASDIVDVIVGHGKKSVGDAYGDFPTESLRRELEKIPYQNIGLAAKAAQ